MNCPSSEAPWPRKEQRASALSKVNGELDEGVPLSIVSGCRGRDPRAQGGEEVRGEELGTRRKGSRVNREQTSQTRRKAKPLLTEKENEIKMKIDEAERKGDSFHQQVCQMKLRDKSCGRRSLGARVGLWPAPHTCLGSLGISG